ncbi:MAG: PaaI family thioesterase [Acidimicrobiia bacterium]|nr:PaaI family thioesterase [Acidimicrobiia bacterium]NNL70295.1 PaaI family thioesterase [Acidimicrobiia bacterium]
MHQSLQDTYGPGTICFGCGPANEKGLQIKSFVADEAVVADFDPSPEHQAFPGVVNGGIIGALFDCHMNWTAAQAIMTAGNLDRFPVTVTADFHVRLRRPTPYPATLHLAARTTSVEGNRATVEAEMTVDDKVTATCTATFVAVEEGHPAYHRW